MEYVKQNLGAFSNAAGCQKQHRARTLFLLQQLSKKIEKYGSTQVLDAKLALPNKKDVWKEAERMHGTT